MPAAKKPKSRAVRHAVIVLGDQLDVANAAFDGFDAKKDVVLMAESVAEGAQVWSHKARIALFLSAMRHYAQTLEERGWDVLYSRLGESKQASLSTIFEARLAEIKPERVIVCEPGEYRILKELQDLCARLTLPLEVREDTHFMISREEFARWAGSKKTLLMEMFYRHMRKKTGVLMAGGEPEGGEWNFDHENRGGFPKSGPGGIPEPWLAKPDAITLEVFAEVEKHFPDHPGSLEHFVWPVTRDEALKALDRFVNQRLIGFGKFQDAMWTNTPFGWHALISTSLNLKLLNPREVVDAALRAWKKHKLPLPAVEGFIRQVMGWREFIRGVYWLDMPGMRTANHYGHSRKLPAWYWSGESRMNCMRESVGQTMKYGFAHHIQRLMVTGNFALLAGLSPQAVADWYLAVYVDAVEWVELPNVAGMALYANGGRFTSKPYVASGAYIKRMSNYCQGCAYKPEVRHGETACPMTTLYWNFLDTHEEAMRGNMRTALMVRNIARLDPAERSAIRMHAAKLLENLDAV